MRERWILVALLVLLASELALGIASDGLTIDEVVYIGAGYRHLRGDFRLNPEQPPVAKLLGALLLYDVEPPRGDPAEAGEWGWGYALVQGGRPGRTIARARVPSAVLTVALALVLWAWARSAYGGAAGLAAAGLAALHPSLLAHGHLLTTDLPGTLTMVLASWAFWAWDLRPGLPRGALVGLAVGVAVATRLTGVLLVPVFAVLLLVRLLRSPGADRAALARAAGSLVLVTAALGTGVIWAVYGFRYSPWPGASLQHAPEADLGLSGVVLARLESLRALPWAFLAGARFVLGHNLVGHPTFLLGEVSTSGWKEYYLVAFLVKNTPGFLAVSALVAVDVVRRGRRLVEGVEIHWVLPALAMFLAASLGHIQIGERYILPVYPYLILLGAGVVHRLAARARGPAVVGLLGLLHAGPALLSAPGGYLSYFNLLAGGRSGGHRILLDSNLDWGQDLPRLARWMRTNGVETVQLGYHGSDSPDRFGIRHEDLPGVHIYAPSPPRRPFQGIVAVSPNLWAGIFYPPGENPYAVLRARPPDDRAGVFLIYRNPGGP